jgi:hypothetical protein
MSENDIRGWGWRDADSKEHGPFSSREEALFDIAEYFEESGPNHSVEIGRVRVLEAKDFIRVDIDNLLEEADDNAFDVYGWDESRLFDFANMETVGIAVNELKDFVEAWVEKYLTNMTGFWVLDDEEEVLVQGKGGDAEVEEEWFCDEPGSKEGAVEKADEGEGAEEKKDV